MKIVDYFNTLELYSIRIIELEDNVKCLIFLCRTTDGSSKLHDLFSSGINIIISETENKKEIVLDLMIPKHDAVIIFPTNESESIYKPLAWLKDGEVTHWTTGYRDLNGRLQWIDDYYRLDGHINT